MDAAFQLYSLDKLHGRVVAVVNGSKIKVKHACPTRKDSHKSCPYSIYGEVIHTSLAILGLMINRFNFNISNNDFRLTRQKYLIFGNREEKAWPIGK